jgi:hypothetical protein
LGTTALLLYNQYCQQETTTVAHPTDGTRKENCKNILEKKIN